MRIGNQKVSSKSNFLLQDVMNALTDAIHDHHYENVSHWTIEMIDSGQVKPLLIHILQMLANHYLTKNAWLLCTIANKLKSIEDHRFSSKSPIVRSTIVEITLLLAQQHRSEISFEKYGEDASIVFEHIQNIQHIASQYSNYRHEDVLGVHNHDNSRKQGYQLTSKELSPNFELDNEVVGLCNALCDHITRGDMKSVGALLHCLLCICEGKKRRLDVVVIWNILSLYLQSMEIPKGYSITTMKRYIGANAALYDFLVTKKNERTTRLPFLFVNFFMLCRKKHVCWVNEDNDFIAQIVSDIFLKTEEKKGKGKSKNKSIVSEQTSSSYPDVDVTEDTIEEAKTKKMKNNKNKNKKSASINDQIQEQLKYLMYFTTTTSSSTSTSATSSASRNSSSSSTHKSTPEKKMITLNQASWQLMGPNEANGTTVVKTL
jgi:hypothetical protein